MLETPIDETAALDAYSQAIIAAAERAGPAVVKIETGRTRRGRFDQGLGSGVLYSSDGYILTNAHVVAGARQVVVSLPDKRRFPAGVVGAEPAHDLAVLRVAERGLPVAQLHAAALRVGQLVVAIGNPFGFDFTVTAGVVSALGRSLPTGDGRTLEPLLQTDTSINPGNSGGPLVDVHGRVVGITTAIVPYAQGLGFAVPTTTALDVIGRINAEHRATLARGALGVSALTTPLAPETRERHRIAQEHGVLLLEVARDGAADRASLRAGDVILMLGDHLTDSVDSLKQAIATLRGRSPWRVSFVRDGRQRSVSLVPTR